jgi:hypothetical protein
MGENLESNVLYLYQCARKGCSGDVLDNTLDYHQNHVCPICEHDLLPPMQVSGQNILLLKQPRDRESCIAGYLG